MSHTIYAANGKVSHIHRRMCEWDYTIDKSLVCLQSERRRYVRIKSFSWECLICWFNPLRSTRDKIHFRSRDCRALIRSLIPLYIYVIHIGISYLVFSVLIQQKKEDNIKIKWPTIVLYLMSCSVLKIYAFL